MNQLIRELVTHFGYIFSLALGWFFKKVIQQTKKQHSSGSNRFCFNRFLKKLSVITVFVMMTACFVSCTRSEESEHNPDIDNNLSDMVDKKNAGLNSKDAIDENNIDLNLDDVEDTKDEADKKNVDLNLDHIKNLKDAIEEGLDIIPEQTFWVELENYGKVKFVSGSYVDSYPALDFYLVDSEDNILYRFPDFFANEWIFFEIKEIVFQDVNNDDKIDIIVTAYYMVGAGENSGKPFSAATIFFQNGMEFVSLPEFDENMWRENQEERIETILKYAEEHQDEIQKEIEKITMKNNE